jgi:cytochrome b6-f complex iron-sulfur subunit
MKRKEFLYKMSGGLATSCITCLALSCSKEELKVPAASSSANPVSNPVSSAISVNLSSELKSINDFIAKSGVIIIRVSSTNVASSFLAFSSVCPHAGATVEYNNSKSTFLCAAHGSTFASDGSLTQGPAPKGLTKLLVEVIGTTLTIKA